MVTTEKIVETDVLVVGSGGAGSMAALEASKHGVHVTLATKGLFGRDGATNMAVYSCTAAFGHADPRDNAEVHFTDTIRGGYYLPNQRLVELYTKEAPERILDLERCGARFVKTPDGKFAQNRLPGYSYPRAIFRNDSTGKHIMDVLRAEVRKHSTIRIFEEFFITNLITSEGSVVGATGIDLKTGGFVGIKAKSTVLAGGGGMAIYEFNAGALENTGDCYAMAYRMGAELIDMEFVQYFPTALIYPRSLRGYQGVAVLRYRLDTWLLNAHGERFMRRYDPSRMEATTRDVLTRAIRTEVLQGRGSEHEGVYMDVSHIPAKIIDYFINREWGGHFRVGGIDMIKDLKIDPRKDPIEVAPVAHYFCGGMRINECGETSVESLYACGENAGGLNGANRLAGQALSQILVTGVRAGKYAAESALRKKSPPKIDHSQVESEKARVSAILERERGVSPISLRKRLQKVMETNSGVFRSESSLKNCLVELEKIRQDLSSVYIATKTMRYNREWISALELTNMVDLAEMVVRAALMRTESRGNHYREDCPNQDDKHWVKNIVIQQDGDGRMSLRIAPIVVTTIPLDKLLELKAEALVG